jgi:hypothetical protein
MAQLAENERIKLKAAFYNNLAVGAAITGIIVPFMAFYGTAIANGADYLNSPFAFIKIETVGAMVSAFAISFLCRKRADFWIQTLENDD